MKNNKTDVMFIWNWKKSPNIPTKLIKLIEKLIDETGKRIYIYEVEEKNGSSVLLLSINKLSTNK